MHVEARGQTQVLFARHHQPSLLRQGLSVAWSFLSRLGGLFSEP